MNNFNSNLKKLRNKRGLKQEEVAEQINVSRSTYGAYEQGIREPEIGLLITIAEFYGVAVDQLLGVKPLAMNNVSRKKYQVELEEVSLEEAVSLLSEHRTVFYTYHDEDRATNKVLHKLGKDELWTTILYGATYLTPCSFVEKIEGIKICQ